MHGSSPSPCQFTITDHVFLTTTSTALAQGSKLSTLYTIYIYIFLNMFCIVCLIASRREGLKRPVIQSPRMFTNPHRPTWKELQNLIRPRCFGRPQSPRWLFEGADLLLDGSKQLPMHQCCLFTQKARAAPHTHPIIPHPKQMAVASSHRADAAVQ